MQSACRIGVASIVRRRRIHGLLAEAICLGRPRLKAVGMMMLPFADWFPPAFVGATFTALGAIKVYGLRRGIVGGRDKPALQRLCGT